MLHESVPAMRKRGTDSGCLPLRLRRRRCLLAPICDCLVAVGSSCSHARIWCREHLLLVHDAWWQRLLARLQAHVGGRIPTLPPQDLSLATCIRRVLATSARTRRVIGALIAIAGTARLWLVCFLQADPACFAHGIWQTCSCQVLRRNHPPHRQNTIGSHHRPRQHGSAEKRDKNPRHGKQCKRLLRWDLSLKNA